MKKTDVSMLSLGGALFGMQGRTAQEMAFIVMDFISKNIYNIVGGIIILAAAWLAAQAVGKLLHILLVRKKADVTITKFLVDILKFLIMAVAVLITLGNFGITIAPFIAGLGALGFGASVALQGPLSNYASGATLIFTKPFKVGDILEVNGEVGEVEDMTLARTIIRAIDGTKIVIPNKKIIGEIIHNYSECKLLEITVGVTYETDIDQAIKVIKNVVMSEKKIMSKPEPKVGISTFADSAISIYARLWCRQSQYWDLMFDINRKILDEFNNNSITMPYPRRDVRIIGKES